MDLFNRILQISSIFTLKNPPRWPEEITDQFRLNVWSRPFGGNVEEG